jgi:hypothetical protein
MKVKELIEHLTTLPPDAEVEFWSQYEGDVWKVRAVAYDLLEGRGVVTLSDEDMGSAILHVFGRR